jgi:hypothetical protein
VPGNLPNALIVGYVGYIESTSSCLPESEKRVCAELAARRWTKVKHLESDVLPVLLTCQTTSTHWLTPVKK